MQKISPEAIISAARQQAGADQFDSESFREGLDILAYDINRSEIVSEQGVQVFTGLYTQNLSNRLQVAEYLRQHPQVLDAPVSKPVFILGMPRTGTTMLSYLLDSDPARRSLLKWEVATTAPPAAPGAIRTDARCLAQQEMDDAWTAADPGMAARHYETADGPTECVFLQAQDFKSLMLGSLTPTPTYNDWMLICDMTSAYEYQRKVMQLLQSTNGGKWTLKMPSHALFVRTLFKVFPDARVIWTHRDPFDAMASVMSLIGLAQPTTSTITDREYLARALPLQMGSHLSRMLEFAGECPDAVYHCYYRDLTKDPMAEMARIYKWLGERITPEAEAGMRNWIRENPQGRFGKHSYGLEEWNLTRDILNPYFADYLRVHPVAS
jgi:hypothetical protein